MFDYEAYDSTWRSRIRDLFRDNPRARWRFALALLFYLNFAVSLVFPIEIFWILSLVPAAEDIAERSMLTSFLFPVLLAILSFLLGRYFYRTWENCNQLTAQEAEEADPRQPIVYLRPFKADKIKFVTAKLRAERVRNIRSSAKNAARGSRGGIVAYLMATAVAEIVVYFWAKGNSGGVKGEALFIEPFKAVGPVIAIGRPGERVPPIGAARVYVGNNEWQDVVTNALARAQLVVMFAGITPGFFWEMNYVLSHENFVPALIILPFFQRYSPSDAAKFGDMFREASGQYLPANFGMARAIYVPSKSTFKVLQEDPHDYDMNFISPFLSPIARVIEMNKPGFIQLYQQSAHAERLKFEQDAR